MSGRTQEGAGARSIFAVLIFLMVGLRFEVGGDWGGYLGHLRNAVGLEFSQILSAGDPGYVFLNWLVARSGGDVWVVNLLCAGLFSWGLLSFAKAQPRPWLALAVAIPYLVVVVAMGYTRQSVAIGLVMLGLVALGASRSKLKFVFWIALAATFHKSAVLLIPIAAVAEGRSRLWTVFWVGGATVIAYFTLLESSVDRLISGYIDSGLDSSGAAIRVAMNAVPALLLLYYRRRIPLRQGERGLWTVLALVALALVPALLVSPSSTAVDRLGLYLIPLQMLVLSRLPDTFAQSEQAARRLSMLVVLYSAGVLFVWLNYASHANYWLPYRVYPL
ncbi:EpsG family protein [Aurantimonas endophytica]|uniref:Uncharacterized protein n=1 Tax=Aurantimonas endophytica TaxID=1522175 RepID=A0A7W6MRA8_9HYPH|nr:EpsG family protein [Aurantimonas endophytica]MBB4004832.1 hypothetical protein [Aurantimonas endophytica]MCO6405642.1 EpsG family protein [Aurantimonas endophytica]